MAAAVPQSRKFKVSTKSKKSKNNQKKRQNNPNLKRSCSSDTEPQSLKMCGASGSPKMQKEQVRVSVDPRNRISGANRMDPKSEI